MRTIVVPDGASGKQFNLEDPDAQTEVEFEVSVASALTSVYSDYSCVIFGGTFDLDGERHRPDFALVARDYSHWFIIEVELASHSLEGHVIPQVRTFQWGDPHPDCASSLARSLGVQASQGRTLVDFVPRSVAVVVNKHDSIWEKALGAVDVQMLTVSRFSNATGETAVEVHGALTVIAENLGFGTYSAVDRSLIFPRTVRLPLGRVQLTDASGAPSWWIVGDNGAQRWITKEHGTPSVPDGAFVQIIRAVGGKLTMRLASDGPGRPR